MIGGESLLLRASHLPWVVRLFIQDVQSSSTRLPEATPGPEKLGSESGRADHDPGVVLRLLYALCKRASTGTADPRQLEDRRVALHLLYIPCRTVDTGIADLLLLEDRDSTSSRKAQAR